MLALFFVISASAFQPQEFLGCDLTAGDTFEDPTSNGTACKLDEESLGNTGHKIVVDMNGVAIPNYFLLNILQLVFMIMFNDLCMITVAWDNVPDSKIPKRCYRPLAATTP